MEQILMIREALIGFYKRYETMARFICKLAAGLFIFSAIGSIGCPAPQLSGLLGPPFALPFTLLMSVLFAVCPITVCYGLIIANITLQMSGAFGVAIFVLLFLLCVMFFYVRLAPKESVLILAVCFSFAFHAPCVAPLLAGLYFGATSVIPVSIGVFLWEAAPAVAALARERSAEGIGLLEIPVLLAETYETLFTSVVGNESWVITAFIFSMVVIVVFVIARSGVDYAKDLAIGVGAFTCVAGFVTAALVAGVEFNLGYMIITTVFSALIAELVRFFDVCLDYRGTERVQFEDEMNFYVVKVIPKVAMTRHWKMKRRYEDVQANEEYDE